jgi:DNA-binding XRE family transcriptional regulator
MSEVFIDGKEVARVSRLNYKLPQKLRELLDGFKWAIHNKKQSVVTIVDGRSGMGKTTISFQMAKYMSESFSLDSVHFTPEDFLEALTHTQKGDTLVFDEAMLLSSRSALSAINKMIVIAMSMIRSKNLFIIFNVNSVFDLDRNLALSRADLLLNCYGDSLTDKGKFIAFFKGVDGRDRIKELYINGKKYYSYAHPKGNFFTTFSSEFVVDEDKYEEKKQIGVNTFLKSSKKTLGDKDRKSRDLYIKYLYEKCDLTQEEIADIGNLNRGTVINILKSLKPDEDLEE